MGISEQNSPQTHWFKTAALLPLHKPINFLLLKKLSIDLRAYSTLSYGHSMDAAYKWYFSADFRHVLGSDPAVT